MGCNASLPMILWYNVQAKKFDKAVAIMGRNQWWDKLNQVVGQLQGQSDAEKSALRLSAAFFRRAGQNQFARETYVKLQDYQVRMLCCSDATVGRDAPHILLMHPMLGVALTKAVIVVCTQPSLPSANVQYLNPSCQVLPSVNDSWRGLALPRCDVLSTGISTLSRQNVAMCKQHGVGSCW